MKHLVSAMLIGLTLAACGDEESTGPGQTTPPAVVSVVVTPASAALVSLEETVQLTASARDANGNTISGKTFTWSSSGRSVATVSSTQTTRSLKATHKTTRRHRRLLVAAEPTAATGG